MAATSIYFPRKSPSGLWLWETSPKISKWGYLVSIKLLYYLFTGLGVCETLCLLKAQNLISWSKLQLFLYASPCWPSEPDVWVHLPSIGPPVWNPSDPVLDPSCFRRTTAIKAIFLLVGCLPGRVQGGVSLPYIVSLPLLPVSCDGFLLYRFSCRKSFLLVSKLFSLIAVCK